MTAKKVKGNIASDVESYLAFVRRCRWRTKAGKAKQTTWQLSLLHFGKCQGNKNKQMQLGSVLDVGGTISEEVQAGTSKLD